MHLSIEEAVLRLFLALLLGSVVGMEREYTQQSAGLRTHILVCMGATVFMLVSISDLGTGMGLVPSGETGISVPLQGDPSRIAAQIVSGIGFIGGGAVLRHGASVRGLTTAASLWTMASIGMLLGVGFYQLAIVTTLFTFLVLFIIGGLERTMFKKYMKKFTLLKVQVSVREANLSEIEQWVEKSFPAKTLEMKVQHEPETRISNLSYTIDLRGLHADVNILSRKLNSLEGVTSASIKVQYEDKDR